MSNPIPLLAKPVVAELEAKIAQRASGISKSRGYPPGLAVIWVGDDSASGVYVTNKERASARLGISGQIIRFSKDALASEVQAAVEKLNCDPRVDGILIQRPLPKARGYEEEFVSRWIMPEKDVDAFHPENVGKLHLGLPCPKPCTPQGVIELLDFYKIPIAGRTACVVGRSSIVGKPLAALLLQRDATVLHTHSKSPDLAQFTRQADLLLVAAGVQGLIGPEHVKPGAVLVDVGIHRASDKKVVGDIRPDAYDLSFAYTPVPGGVGPMTIARLLVNTVEAAEQRSLNPR